IQRRDRRMALYPQVVEIANQIRSQIPTHIRVEALDGSSQETLPIRDSAVSVSVRLDYSGQLHEFWITHSHDVNHATLQQILHTQFGEDRCAQRNGGFVVT